MKKNIKKIFAGLAALVSVSCANESMEPDASIDKKVETKTVSISFSAKMSVDDDVTKMGYTRHEGYTWKEKDSLYVIVDTWIDGQWQEVDKHNRAYIHVKDGSISADGKTAEFEGNIKVVGNNDHIAIRALYPYFQFPGYQYYVKDGWKNSLLMGAASGQLGVDDISIELKNASAFMCLNLSSDDNVMISQIELTALASEGSEKMYIPLSGQFYSVSIPFDDSRPTFEWSNTTTYGDVFLFCDRESEGVILPSEPESFYMSVPAGDYPNGFSIEVTDVMGRIYYRRFLKGKSVTLEQNTIYNLPNLKLSSGDFMSYSFPIPDNALRNALLAEEYISVLGDSVRCMITDKGHELHSLRVPDECKSLEGIKRFTSLTDLDVRNSQVSDIDISGTNICELSVSGNEHVKTINASGSAIGDIGYDMLDVRGCMNLTELNLTGCKKLRTLNVGSAPLSGLNLSGLSNFECLIGGGAITGTIDLSGTGIKSLNNYSDSYAAAEIILDNCKNLTSIDLEQCNNMTKLSLTGCSSLARIYCRNSNSLTSIDLSTSTELSELYCQGLSRLKDINLSANNKLECIEIWGTALTDLDISDKLNLTRIECYGNDNLENLVISNCPELEFLDCNSCNLEALNVGSCSKLQSLYCDQNWLTSLEIAPDCLTSLGCSQNMLGGTLDLTAFTKLDYLGCNNNMLEKLLLPPSVSTLICSTNNLSELDITSCPELMKSGDEDSFCVGKQRKNKVLTLHLTSQQNRYWLRTYSETEENTNVTTDIR